MASICHAFCQVKKKKEITKSVDIGIEKLPQK